MMGIKPPILASQASTDRMSLQSTDKPECFNSEAQSVRYLGRSYNIQRWPVFPSLQFCLLSPSHFTPLRSAHVPGVSP